MKKRQPKKYQSVITRRILQSAKKLSATFLIVSFMGSLLTIPGTNAGFSDSEESTDNIFTATSLDAKATYVEYFSVVGMDPEQQPDSRITLRNVGGLDFRYGVQYRKTGGDTALCEAFLVTAERNGTKVFSGLLKDFDKKDVSGNPFVLASLQNDNWDFIVSLPNDVQSTLENKSCQWSFDFTAWQTDQADATTGFFDVETVGPHSIATGEWLTPGDVIINEVMWMGSAGESADEWIELKNMTNEDIDLSNWDIENGGSGSGHIEIPNGYTIKANSYFLITKKKWDDTAVNLTGDLAHNKGYTHVAGMSLHNDGEQLTLEDKDNNKIDSTPVAPWPAGSNGALKQSMERNDIPGDGALATNWHTCVSGAANGLPYWDATGNNFGTPNAANLSPIVMNEFVFNPEGDDAADRPEGEWIELYNILEEDIDVAGWYFTNAEDDKMVVTEDNTASGETMVPGRGTLVVYLEEAFLDNTADTLSLYAPGILPENESDDVREDTYSYEDADLLPEGKSFARFPDGEGIWIDPVATPGEENMMTEVDVQIFRRLTYDQCFEDEQLRKDVTEEVCSPLFLHFIGMIDEVDDRNMVDAVVLDILEMIRLEEEENLLTLLVEEIVPIPEAIDPVSDPEPVVPIDVISPVEEVPAEETPVEEVSGDVTEEYVEPIMAEEQEEVPQEEIPEAKMEEAPATESLPDTIVAIP